MLSKIKYKHAIIVKIDKVKIATSRFHNDGNAPTLSFPPIQNYQLRPKDLMMSRPIDRLSEFLSISMQRDQRMSRECCADSKCRMLCSLPLHMHCALHCTECTALHCTNALHAQQGVTFGHMLRADLELGAPSNYHDHTLCSHRITGCRQLTSKQKNGYGIAT
jgi:hypothetical protein